VDWQTDTVIGTCGNLGEHLPRQSGSPSLTGDIISTLYIV